MYHSCVHVCWNWMSMRKVMLCTGCRLGCFLLTTLGPSITHSTPNQVVHAYPDLPDKAHLLDVLAAHGRQMALQMAPVVQELDAVQHED